jgi:uncharacterized membrane protein (DUF106 family)
MADEAADTRLVRSTAIPNWMVLLITGILVTLFWGGVQTVLQDRNRLGIVEVKQADIDRRFERYDEKQQNVLDAINGMRKDFAELERKIDARMP